MFSELLFQKIPNEKRLLEYGFVQDDRGYHYRCDMMEGDFCLQITLDQSGTLTTSVTEKGSGEAYILYRTKAQGTFVGRMREEIETVLKKIVSQCFDPCVFKQAQTKALLEYAYKTYGDAPEFLWEKTPNNAILRRKDSQKWYGAIITVPKNKLGLGSEQSVEIIDLHATSTQLQDLLKRPHFYPGWHMNKKSWYTVILDGSVEKEELFRLLDESYRLAKKQTKGE